MTKVIHILAHNIEDFISGDYNDFDHHSIRFLEKVRKFAKMENFEIDQELWVLTKKNKKIIEINHKKGFKIKLFPISIKLPLPLEISFSLLKEIIKFKSSKKIIWHLHSYYLFMYDFIAPILFLKKQKFLMHYRGGGPSFTPKAFLYTLYHYLIGLRIALNLASFVLVQNHNEEKRVKNFLKVKKEKIVYFPNTVSKNSILNSKSLKRGGDRVKLVIAGRLKKIKEKELIIEIFKKILSQKKNCFLEIIGLRKKDKKLTELKNAFSNQVNLFGWLKKKELLERFQKSDIYLHLNTKGVFEGSPMTLIEAQSQGLPVLAFDIEGVRDIIRPNLNGWLVRNYQELKDKLEKIITNPSILSTMKKNALGVVKKDFVDEKYFPILLKIYQSLIK